MIRNPNTNEEDVVYQPLISQKNSTYQVFYVPWNLSNHHNGAQTKLLEKFSEYVVHKQRTELIKIRLAPKECLFIDNHRMLHCRGKLPENTKRHLIRYYISTCLIS
ncbi:MAG: TauD/TfdA family dioxygenase [Moorea sp. SIO3I8]|nr:TauD/TfdA family dioxygenase [Moorena sp. SIO3I8]